MKLHDIQQGFKDTILDPETAEAENEAFRNIFKSDTGISLENRFKVYRNNVIRSLTDVVLAALPMTKKLAGEKFLEQAVRAYVTQNLPDKADLTLYGITFPAFIATYEPARSLPYIADLTRLEWAWEAAYYAADDQALDPDELAAIDEDSLPDLRFTPRSSFALIDSDYPLDEIVDFCRNTPDGKFTLHDRGCKLMVLRPYLKVQIHKLDDHEFTLLSALQEGKTIHEAAALIDEDDDDFDLAAFLQKHLIRGTFASHSLEK
ncbi:MAG: putative DNA-binding domain-containing protein [Rhodospirillales bacterium]|nr:putative DNA-binding domain-containing protein [Rhodospirillales bacterium]MCB9994914.1 putative DNA-binding domain-containing protein [Rhodospirillales bacterium]